MMLEMPESTHKDHAEASPDRWVGRPVLLGFDGSEWTGLLVFLNSVGLTLLDRVTGEYVFLPWHNVGYLRPAPMEADAPTL